MDQPARPHDDLDLFDPRAVADPFPLYGRLRDRAPVHLVPGTTFRLVSTWDLVEEAAGRTEDFSSNLRGILVRGEDGGVERFPIDMDGAVEQVLATADGATHKLHRKFVLQALGRRIRVLESTAVEVAQQLWDRHAHRGRIDWASSVSNVLPPTVLATLLGMPEEDLPQLVTAAYESVELLSGLVTPERLDHLIDATVGLMTYLERAVLEPGEGDGLIAGLAAAVEAGEIELGTAVMVLVQLVGAGAETTSGLIGTAARQLALDPELQTALRSDPALVDPFLDECLRVDPPLRGHYRVATRNTQLGGVPVPKDSHLLLLWSAANRDPARYTDPDRIDITRAGVRQHLAFGKGAHFCVGSSLARLEATAAVNVLLRATASFSLDPEGAATWVPSVVVRRLDALPLVYQPA